MGREPTPGSYTTGGSTTLSETGRHLLKPEEILLLPSDCALLFHKDHKNQPLPVIPTRLAKFYNDPAFRDYNDYLAKCRREPDREYDDHPLFKRNRTGRMKSPGVTAAVMAVAILALSGLVVLFAASFRPPTLQPVPFDSSPPAYSDPWGQGVNPAAQRRDTGPPVSPFVPSRSSTYGRQGIAPRPYGGGMGGMSGALDRRPSQHSDRNRSPYRRQSRSDDLPSRSGFLIPIR
jgi:hypothetical protein